MATFYYNRDPKYPINVTEDTLRITPYTFMRNSNSMWEERSIKYFYDNVPRDTPVNIVDIGAQSGLYTLFAKYLPMSNFYAFEPFADTYKLLNENIAFNNITNVTTYNMGLSNVKGDAILNTSISHNGLHTIGSHPIRFNDVLPVKITVDTLDNIFYETDTPVHFIKIDTEGWEYFILQGGEKTIKKYKPFIQIEWFEPNMAQCNVNMHDFNRYIAEQLEYKVDTKIDEELFLRPM